MSVLHPKWDGPHGWTFGDSEMSTRDHVAGHNYLYEIYQESKPDFTGKKRILSLGTLFTLGAGPVPVPDDAVARLGPVSNPDKHMHRTGITHDLVSTGF